MSESQKQNIIDINSMAPFVSAKITEIIKNLMETEIEQEILRINPEVEFDDMDITEKLMLLEYVSKTDEEREQEETISFEDALKEAGLTLNDLHD